MASMVHAIVHPATHLHRYTRASRAARSTHALRHPAARPRACRASPLLLREEARVARLRGRDLRRGRRPARRFVEKVMSRYERFRARYELPSVSAAE